MKRNAIIATMLVLTLVMISCVFFGCDPLSSSGAYYLTRESTNWAKYDSDENVPSDIKFVQDATNAAVYTLTVNLTKGDNFRIAQVNAVNTYGYDAVFSSENKLTSGADNKISVATTGTYVLTLNVEDGDLQYICTPEQGNSDNSIALLVAIDDATNVTLTIGGVTNKQLSATVTMDDGSSNHSVTWISSNPNVATVTEGGLVTAVSAGTTEITAKSGDITSQALTVTVEGLVTLNKTALTMNVGDTETLVATALGGATIGAWSSTDEKVITVDNGEITAVGSGSATVRVTYLPRAGATARFVTCVVNVNTPVKEISLNNTSISVPIGSSIQLKVSFTPTTATNQNYTATLSDGGEFVDIVKNGATITVTPKAIGSATLTVKSEDGNCQATCVITIVAAGEVTSFIDNTTARLYQRTGENKTTLTVSVINDTIDSVAWSSSVASVATVSGDGATATVTAVEYGTTTITAQISTVGGKTLTKTCTVLVAPDNFYLYGGAAGWWNAIDATIDDYKFAEDNGVYTLTLDNMPINDDFRIGDDDSFTSQWKGVRYEHLSSTVNNNAIQGGNDRNGGYNVQITVLGTYTFKIDLTKGKAVLEIKCDAVAVTGIIINADNSTLTANSETNSATITLTVNPNNALYLPSDIVWTCENENIEMVVADDKMSVTITAKDDAKVANVVVRCEVKGKSATANLTVIASGAQVVEVTEINFAQSAYSFNVNNGGAWTGTVIATVNDDATNQNVTYSASDSAITIDAATGVITASKIGTYTITATAAGNTAKTTTVQVTFYSDMFYLTGDTNGWEDAGSATTTVATKYENYTFAATDETNTSFVLDVALTAGSKFQVMFCGTADWGNVIKGANLVTADSDATTDSTGNIVAGAAGLYRVTINLTGTTPKITAVRKSDIPTFVAKVLVGGEAVIISENSVSANNSYAMEFLRTFAENDEFTITIVNGSDTVTSINNIAQFTGNVGMFSDSEGVIKCVATGKYRFEISYNMSGAYTVTVSAIGDEGPVVSDAYSILVSGASNNWTPTAIKDANLFYDSASGEYTFYFEMQQTAWKGFGFVINNKDGAKAFEVWKDGASLLTTEAKELILVNSSTDMQYKTTGTLYFKFVLKTTGITSIDVAKTEFAQPTVD